MQKHSHQQPLKLKSEDLVAMDQFTDDYPIHIDLAYARDDNLLLGEAIYHKNARLWCYKGLADIVLLAARICHEKTGYHVVLFDGLRTTDAQALILQTRRVRNNPHWHEGTPRLLSPPGAGAHPRGMAIDLSLCTADGSLINMGTDFDFLSDDPSAKANPAHRDHPDLSIEVQKNRSILDSAMVEAAQKLKTPLFPLPQEWWDFRLPPDIYERYAPLSDADLPSAMRMAISI